MATKAGLGQRIRKRRKAIGMTQADLAAALGVSFQQVQKYETGLSSISDTRLQQICDVMSLPHDYFRDADGALIGKSVVASHPDNLARDEIDRFVASREGQRLIEAFLRISDAHLRTRVLDFISSLGLDHDGR